MSVGTSHTGLDPRARANLYHFLASAYLRPLGTEALRYLTRKGVMQGLASVLGARAVEAFKSLLSGAPGAAEPADLEQEYMDLFATPSGRYVTPFEDVWCGATDGGQPGPLLGPRAIAVKQLYRAAGAEIDGACKELPTHVGVELAFMSYLCTHEAAASESGNADRPCAAEALRSIQERFLREHLNAWYPQLSRAIQAQAGSEVYRGLAQLTEAFLARDAADLRAGASPAGGAEGHRH